jgi:3-methyl-2-oxobutanoate hydroxymethyltransferase
MKKQTVSTLIAKKGKEKIAVITAYDALFSSIFDKEVDCILVGDSLNSSFMGASDTLSATLDQMIYHTKAVCNGAKNSFIICDLPFGTYYNETKALESSIQVFQNTNADAVKIEGGKEKASIIQCLTQNSIAVVGHIGLMPQDVRRDGGYKIKGKDEKSIEALVEDAQSIEKAGACMIVVEGVKSDAAKRITEAVNIPTIGIGAGLDTDGQVLVWSDMLGFLQGNYPKFVKQYLDGTSIVEESVQNYVQDIKTLKFPSKNETY